MLLLLTGCVHPPDVRAVEVALGTATAITYAGTHAAGWALGETLPCDDAAGAGDAWEGAVELGPDCPVPGVGEARGSITVAGHVEADGSGELGADFSGADGLYPRSVTAFVTTADGEGLSVVFAGVDVTLSDGAGVGETGLVTEVDRGDPADGTDDRYTVNGAVQVVLAGDDAHTDQLVFESVVLDAKCGENPVSGGVTIQQADAGDETAVDELQLGFHPACDGTLDVVVAVGVSAAATGSKVAIDLGR